jgi:hypothetical protein
MHVVAGHIHIVPKFFYPHELQKSGEVNILHTKSCENLADLFTKYLPAPSFFRCVHGIGMRRLREMQGSWGDDPSTITHNMKSWRSHNDPKDHH